VRGSQVVQVLSTGGEPVESLLTEFYSSAMMSFISWEKAYCLFPYTTFVRGGKFCLRRDFARMDARYVAKYVGCTYNNVPWQDEPELQSARRVGDHLSWVIPFDTEGIDGQHQDLEVGGPLLPCSAE
jgi:hypothetical protein